MSNSLILHYFLRSLRQGARQIASLTDKLPAYLLPKWILAGERGYKNFHAGAAQSPKEAISRNTISVKQEYYGRGSFVVFGYYPAGGTEG